VTTEHVPDWFGRVIGVLAEGWSKRLTETQVRLYWQGLKDLTPEQIKAGSSRALKESDFFPSVAFIRRCTEGSAEDAVVLAWAKARRSAADVGAYATVMFEDGAIGTAIEAAFGSWAEFCGAEEGPELYVRRQEFLAAYRAARARPPAPRTLRGLCEVGGTLGQKSLVAHVQEDGTATFAPQTALTRR
jgi:hypothetical protein